MVVMDVSALQRMLCRCNKVSDVLDSSDPY